jgi:hypothetical protein
MKSCQYLCDEVPEEVSEAVFAALMQIPGEIEAGVERSKRAAVIAERMVADGWRFCPCYSIKRTLQHYRIFDLVDTNLANRLAHRMLLTGVEEGPKPQYMG